MSKRVYSIVLVTAVLCIAALGTIGAKGQDSPVSPPSLPFGQEYVVCVRSLPPLFISAADKYEAALQAGVLVFTMDEWNGARKICIEHSKTEKNFRFDCDKMFPKGPKP